jgi:hypothetical protein
VASTPISSCFWRIYCDYESYPPTIKMFNTKNTQNTKHTRPPTCRPTLYAWLQIRQRLLIGTAELRMQASTQAAQSTALHPCLATSLSCCWLLRLHLQRTLALTLISLQHGNEWHRGGVWRWCQQVRVHSGKHPINLNYIAFKRRVTMPRFSCLS